MANNFLKVIIKFIKSPKIIKRPFYLQYNKCLFSSENISFGKHLKVFNKISIKNRGEIEIGDNFMLTSGDCINPICGNNIGCIFVENKAILKIGNNVAMSSIKIWVKEKIIIGNNVMFGGNVLIMDTDVHPIDPQLRMYQLKNGDINLNKEGKILTKPIEIQDNCWIGANVTILKGITIGKNSIIGAGSIVTSNIPDNCIAAGCPAKVIKKIISEIIIK